jgi:dolichyl-phosphate beta-glucosyltransferase
LTLPPFLSIIIPAHNEETRLPRALEQVFKFLEKQPYRAEVLVVENGSSDRTLDVAQAFSQSFPCLLVLHEDLIGKGSAVRRGMLEATGQYRFFADADFSMPIEQINRFLPPVCSSDLAIASREASGARRYGEPIYRHLTGRMYNFLTRSILLPGLQDTQCGFKCFRGSVAETIFPCLTITGLSFDVEILAIARQRGFTITEIGIPWYYNPGSKISVLGQSWRMFVDLLNIRRNVRLGAYDARA